MPWFVVDDSAHSHPKLMRAGNAAVGLWMRCGSYAAQHLTDGIIPGAVVTMYGTAPQAAKLVKVGLWHARGHDCAGCPQPAEGDYVMHDYLTYNPTRKQVSERRERAAEKKRRQRAKGGPEQKSPSNRPRIEDESRAKRERIEDESSSIHRPLFQEHAGHSVVSPGDSPVTRARAFPSPPLPSQQQVGAVEGGPTGSGATTPLRPDSRAPDPVGAQTIVSEWLDRARKRPPKSVIGQTARQVQTLLAEGIAPDDIRAGLARWMAKGSAPSAIPAFVNEAMNAGTVVPLRAPSQPRPSTTDQRVAAALELGRQMQAEADARAAQGDPA